MANGNPLKVDETLDLIEYLASRIGGRGSCTTRVKRAADHLATILTNAGLKSVGREPFRAVSSTYAPFVFALLLALLASLLVLFLPNKVSLVMGFLMNVVALLGLQAETDLAPNWIRYLLPKHGTHNLTARIQASHTPKKQVVLCAHLDSHRTPVIYSSPAWIATFSIVLMFITLGMALSGVVCLILFFLPISWLRWILLPFQVVNLFAIILCMHADLTPFSPGANDDASGVAVVTALACQLASHPLVHTSVRVLLTDCEEAGCSGMKAYIRQHRSNLPPDTLFIILDEIGAGTLTYLTSDGLILKHPTHSSALKLIKRSATTLPEIELFAKAGAAYTDALVATKAGYPAITLVNTPAAIKPTRWHQMSDVPQFIEPETLEKCHTLVQQILRDFDRS